MPKERLPDAEELGRIRDFSITGLSWSVREGKVTQENAIEIIEAWFPENQIAVESLYKAIYGKSEQS